jgi:hypothetical protein
MLAHLEKYLSDLMDEILATALAMSRLPSQSKSTASHALSSLDKQHTIATGYPPMFPVKKTGHTGTVLCAENRPTYCANRL